VKDFQRVALLFDTYGPLLTLRQQELIQAYYLEDLSLAEIAEGDGVSRQAVHDLIRRAESAMHDYEQRLGLVKGFHERQARLVRLNDALLAGDLSLAASIVAELKGE
jgi:predicted DNA-binding protein YlxM (UPF0122 family)